MNEKSNTRNSLVNSSTTLIMRLMYVIFTFATRSLFIRVLGVNYLGLNAIFSNILSMLSLTEMGLNSAVLFSLYSKIANKDEDEIAATINYYKKLYNIIGMIILIIGLLIMPFIKYIKGIEAVEINYYFVYLLFLINSVSTYFISYKNIMLDADQRTYIVSIVKYSVLIATNIVQIITLYFIKNYFMFIWIMIGCNILSNFILMTIVNKKYPFLKRIKKKYLEKIERKRILKNCSALFVHRVSGFIVFGTDNLLISYFVNLTSVGLYDNYYIIINNISLVVTELLNAVKASVGKIVAISNKNRSYEIYKVLQYVCFLIYGFSVACLYNLISPFITIWLGHGFLLKNSLIIVLLINFYITGMRTVILMYKDANGIFSQDVPKAIAEAVLNFIISILLALRFGLIGIFLGTMLSSLLTSFWVEPYLVFKLYFKRRFIHYWINYIKQVLLLIIVIFFSNIIFNKLYIRTDFWISSVLDILLNGILLLLLTCKQKEFKYLYQKVTTVRRKNERKIS